ncbi:hypothetical protein ACJX0J_031357, partial [Zea mays]
EEGHVHLEKGIHNKKKCSSGFKILKIHCYNQANKNNKKFYFYVLLMDQNIKFKIL